MVFSRRQKSRWRANEGVANEDDERILMEKRRVNVTSFDSSPCLNATINDIDLQKFKHYYLPKALTDDEIEEDRKEGRTVKEQMASFGFYDTKYDCPTNAIGIIVKQGRSVDRA